MFSIFVGTGSVLHCWQILVLTSAYALNLINRCFGSILTAEGPYFMKSWVPSPLGPSFKAWRSLYVWGTVSWGRQTETQNLNNFQFACKYTNTNTEMQ